MDFFILKDLPTGPHKMLAPNVKYDGRIGPGHINYRYTVHFPKDRHYTVETLPMTKLGGRHPETGRKVIQGVGGGSKRRFRWIDWLRLPLAWEAEGPEFVEKVISVAYDPNRDAMIALTGHGSNVRWQIATEGLKAGDLIRTSGKIPPNPVKPVMGDSYPVGALPAGTEVCLVELKPRNERLEMVDNPRRDEMRFFNAKESGKILRKEGDRVIIQDKRLDFSIDQRCQCVVGKVSIHPLRACPIGTPNRARWLGHAPRSGLWKRRDGRFGRKIKARPPVIVAGPEKPERDTYLMLHCDTEGLRGKTRIKKAEIRRNVVELLKRRFSS